MSRVVALTGGVASGKSTVARMLGELGASVVDADQLARQAVEPGQPALDEIRREFGDAVIKEDGTLDRQRLGTLVFSDREALERLNRIVHPKVAELSRAEILRRLGGGAGVVVYDVPLLFEANRQGEFEGVIVASADPGVQLARLMERSGLDEQEARGRIDSQMPLSRKRELATWTVDNSGTEEETRAQVERLWRNELAKFE